MAVGYDRKRKGAGSDYSFFCCLAQTPLVLDFLPRSGRFTRLAHNVNAFARRRLLHLLRVLHIAQHAA